MNKRINKQIETFADNSLEEEVVFIGSETVAAKQLVAWQILQDMSKKGLNKSQMASAMDTSRTSIERLLDPENESVTLKTMDRAATVLDKRLRIELVDIEEARVKTTPVTADRNIASTTAVSGPPLQKKKYKSTSYKASPYKPRTGENSYELMSDDLEYFSNRCKKLEKWYYDVWREFGTHLPPQYRQSAIIDIHHASNSLHCKLLEDWCGDIWTEFQDQLPLPIHQQAITLGLDSLQLSH
jgi:antitoxin HicB